MRAPKVARTAPAQDGATGALMPAPEQATKGRSRDPEIEALLGTRIRAARVAARMTQTELGEAVGISFQQVQKYENGKDRVAASTLHRIAMALDVHTGTFFGDEMLAPAGSIPEVKAAMKAAEVLQQIRSPRVLKQLLVLAKVIADEEADEEAPGQLTNGSTDDAP